MPNINHETRNCFILLRIVALDNELPPNKPLADDNIPKKGF